MSFRSARPSAVHRRRLRADTSRVRMDASGQPGPGHYSVESPVFEVATRKPVSPGFGLMFAVTENQSQTASVPQPSMFSSCGDRRALPVDQLISMAAARAGSVSLNCHHPNEDRTNDGH